MVSYYSTAQIFDEFIHKGWKKQATPRGFILNSASQSATGSITVWGNPETACFIDSDFTFHTPLMERHYYKQRGIQIIFTEDLDHEYHQTQKNLSESGILFHINNVPKPYFKRSCAEVRQKFSSISITEAFLQETGINLTGDTWDRTARIMNHGPITLPPLAALYPQIKHSSISDECFPIFFKSKVVESISLILDYALMKEKKDIYSITKKSRLAAKEALRILNANYVQPPIIEVLAKNVGVDKKTLQNAFLQIVGTSIHDYVLSLKMEKALSLLEDKTLRIADIAKATGYLSKSNFYKAFEKTYGCTPYEMRNL